MPPPKESGDDYIRRIATFIRTHEANLAQGGLARRRLRTRKPEPQSSGLETVLNPLTWFGKGAEANNSTQANAITFSSDTYRLFYLLVRLDALGLAVGSLDVHVDSPARPMTYVDVFQGMSHDKSSDVLSLSSFRSGLSGISKLSLGGSWWGNKPPPPSVEAELKYVYSSFNRLPALRLEPPGPKSVLLDDEAANEPNALPLDVFRTVEVLEIVDVDPRTILGWDKLSQSLRSLTIKKSGLEDVTDVFITAVLEDQARRDGRLGLSRSRTRQVGSFHDNGFSVPETVSEETEAEALATPTAETPSSNSAKLSSLSWAFLKHLSLSDNALTFIPSLPLHHLTSITVLDLSSNLLISVPPGLSALYNLTSLSLSDNMIDSVLGIYTHLGQLLSLDLSRNRLESLCGLERLLALERVDLRQNLIEESAEVGRLAALPHIQSISVSENPLTEIEDDWRVACFSHFWKEGKEILLDGAPAGFYEKRHMSSPPPQQMSSSRPLSVAAAPSPPTVAVGSVKSPGIYSNTSLKSPRMTPSPGGSQPSSSHASPHLVAVGNGNGKGVKKKKPKRIVNLDGDRGNEQQVQERHRRMVSDGGGVAGGALSPRTKSPRQTARSIDITYSPPSTSRLLPESAAPTSSKSPTFSPASPPKVQDSGRPTAARTKSRHSRYMTEFAASSPSAPSVIPEETTPASPPTSSSFSNGLSGSNTLGRRSGSNTLSRASKRRNRISASVYEPQPGFVSESGADADGRSQMAAVDDGAYGPETEARRRLRQADAYRARIEALRSEVGDGWLKVFSQSGLATPTPPSQPSVLTWNGR